MPDDFPDAVRVGDGPQGSLFSRNAIENLPDGIAVPGIAIHDAVILIEYALHLRHKYSS
jgi:hypothetical protein